MGYRHAHGDLWCWHVLDHAVMHDTWRTVTDLVFYHHVHNRMPLTSRSGFCGPDSPEYYEDSPQPSSMTRGLITATAVTSALCVSNLQCWCCPAVKDCAEIRCLILVNKDLKINPYSTHIFTTHVELLSFIHNNSELIAKHLDVIKSW